VRSAVEERAKTDAKTLERVRKLRSSEGVIKHDNQYEYARCR
tara:strand:- start:236 stop:361 length:126 start_codon:yes stop_codon:yes gene_type:complete